MENSTKGDSIKDLVAKHKAKALEKDLFCQLKTSKDLENDQDEIKEEDIVEEEKTIMSSTTFEKLGVCSELQEALKNMGYKCPTKIQAESLQYTLKGKDIIGLAETGSGKTAAFAIPVIQQLLDNPQPFFACVMSPTRELCVQIAEQFEAIGAGIGLRTAVLVGGLDMVSQAIALSKNPHVVIGTPGRMADHLANTKGFHLKKLKFLIFDEADRLLSMDFEKQINLILTQIPKSRNTYLFSATMTSKVQKLQRASLNDPVKIEVSSKYKTVDTLVQNYIFIPEKHKETYLVYLLTQFAGQKMIIFTTTCNQSMKLALILRNLNFKAVNINGQLTQTQRLSALNKFKANERNILIATDVASRGLDIPEVDFVINFDIPQHSKDYVHRVGRTARAGKTGKAITFVTQYDVETFQKIEQLIDKKLDEYPGLDSKAALILTDSVVEATRLAVFEMKNREGKHGKSVDGPDGDDDEETNKDMKLFGKKKQSNNFAHKKGFNGTKSFARKRPRNN
eukprot:403347814